jgi:hypothetical protein
MSHTQKTFGGKIFFGYLVCSKTPVKTTKSYNLLKYDRLFEIRRTEQTENHKDRQYCQICRSGCPTKSFVCVFCFAPEIGNATGMPE